MKKIYLLALAVLGFSANSFAQTSANATASASVTIISPLKMTKAADMNFGIITTDGTAGTVALDFDNSRMPSAGLILYGTTASVAEFTVTGEENSLISITLPPTIALAGNSTGITVKDFAAESDVANTTITGGSITIKIKAILDIPAGMSAGNYTNADGVDITVAYN